jgi:hypothetical protein
MWFGLDAGAVLELTADTSAAAGESIDRTGSVEEEVIEGKSQDP